MFPVWSLDHVLITILFFSLVLLSAIRSFWFQKGTFLVFFALPTFWAPQVPTFLYHTRFTLLVSLPAACGICSAPLLLLILCQDVDLLQLALILVSSEISSVYFLELEGVLSQATAQVWEDLCLHSCLVILPKTLLLYSCCRNQRKLYKGNSGVL